MQKVIVIAGTVVDAKMGCELLRKNGYESIECGISENPKDQTVLQANSALLRKIVMQRIQSIKAKHMDANIVFIYCNSLSGAVNVPLLRAALGENFTVISPLASYQEMARCYHKIALLTANSQSAGHIEAFLCQANQSVIVNGLGCLDMVLDVEKKLSPNAIIEKYSLVEQARLFKKNGCEALVLGCTHFPYFQQALVCALQKKKINLPVIDPGESMLRRLSCVVDSVDDRLRARL